MASTLFYAGQGLGVCLLVSVVSWLSDFAVRS